MSLPSARAAAVVLLLSSSLTAPLSAQSTGAIRGTVTDRATARPLHGALVSIAGTRLQAFTDERGNYLIRSVPLGTYQLSVSLLGYRGAEQTVAVNVGSETRIDFELQVVAIALDELVVTGTGGARGRRTVGSSISSVNVEEITELAPVANTNELLVARIPGLTVLSNSGQAGSSMDLRIRGAGSLNANFRPLFLVDGVLIESGTVEATSLYQGGTALDFLNPDDIESIEVLKGPGASTMYGAAAASGVIQIITKRGRRGAESVQWTASLEFGQTEWTRAVGANTTYWRCTAARQASSANPGCQDPSTVQWWGKDADGNAVLNTGIPEEDIIRNVTVDGVPDGTFILEDDPLFRHPAALRKGNSSNFNISARGGTGRMGYFLSFNRNAEDGVYFNNFSRRTAGRANFDVAVAQNLDLAVRFSYARTHLRQPLNNNASNSINRNAMRGRARGRRVNWEPGFKNFNPWLSNGFDQQNRLERMTIGLTANWNPFDWFRNSLVLGLDKQNYRKTTFYRIDTTGRAPWGTINATGSIAHEIPNVHNWTAQYFGSLSFNPADDWTSQFSAGFLVGARTYRGYFSNGEGLVANNLNLVSSAAVTSADEQYLEQTGLGLFLQQEVGWRNRVFVTGALRFDDNSAFGSDLQLVMYPKAQVSWMLSEEDFFHLGWLNQLRLRGAWGKAGNAPEPFQADRTYRTDQGVAADALVNTLEPAEFGNPNLKSETGVEWETGFDASLFDGRAGLEFTYYNQHTVDALINIPDAGSTGFSGTHPVNIGEISNTGFEVLLMATPVYGRNVSWDMSASLATNRNRLVSFKGVRDEIVFGAFADVQRHREGFPLGAFWATDVERDADGNVVLRDGAGTIVTDPALGDPTLLSSCRWAPDDPTWDREAECDDIYMGPSVPTREVTLTNTFTLFGNLRIFSQFDYRGGHYQWCAICSINTRIDLNTWDINTAGTDLNPDVSLADAEALGTLQTLSHITKADFIKFRELSLTYTLPSSWGRFFRGSRWSFTLAGRNLAVWTKYKGRGDPEVQFSPNFTFARLDYASTPQTRRLSAAVRVTF